MLDDVELMIGQPVTESACEDVAIAEAQINFAMERLQHLKKKLEALDQHGPTVDSPRALRAVGAA